MITDREVGMTHMADLKEDKRPPFNGWAGGDYECLCLACRDKFLGDKRCLTCADCAYKPTPNTPQQEEE